MVSGDGDSQNALASIEIEAFVDASLGVLEETAPVGAGRIVSLVGEFRMAKEALGLLDLTAWRRAKPEIGIDVRHPLDDDKWFRTD